MAGRKGVRTSSTIASAAANAALVVPANASDPPPTAEAPEDLQPGENTHPPVAGDAREQTPEGQVQDLGDGNEQGKEEDGDIAEHARGLPRLDNYQQEIQRLQQQKRSAIAAGGSERKGKPKAGSN